MKQLKDLIAHRDALTAERAALADSLPALQEAERTAPVEFSIIGAKVPSPARQAAEAERMQAEQGLARIDSELARLAAKISHAEALASADKRIAEAQAEEQKAAQQLDRLTASHKLVTDRVAQLTNEAGEAAQRAQQATQAAAQAMAKATAEGDNKAEEAAGQQMDEALEAARQAKEDAEANRALIGALEAEAEALLGRIAEAEAQKNQATNTIRTITRHKLGAEWDAAADALAAIGARLVAQDAGGLVNLELPTFGPGRPTITIDELRARAAKAAA